MFPREIEILLGRIAEEARQAQGLMEMLRDQMPQDATGAEAAVRVFDAVITGVRAITFDASRAAALAELDANTLRACYAQSVVAVDWVRVKGALGDPLDPIADIQEALQALFPGDTLEA